MDGWKKELVHNTKSIKGLTLIEVVVSLAILAIIMVPISLVFTTAFSGLINEADRITAQQSAREILYGKGPNSYGIMGDLDRSDATGDEITIGELIGGSGTVGRSISIKDQTSIKKYKFTPDGVNGGKLIYEITAPDKSIVLNKDYFEDDRSSNGNKVEVKKFTAEIIKKGTDIDADPAKVAETDTDMVKIQLTVSCGRSGDINLESSYRIPYIEK